MSTNAEAFAIAAHGDQRYDGDPYRVHLAAVVRVLNDFGYVGAYEAAGWLHDVVEDTGVSLAEIADRFGSDVARMVDAVTGLGATRAERNARIYAGIAEEPEAAAVKLADRIANVEAASTGSAHGARYLSEADAFSAVVRLHVPPGMWLRLEEALARHRAATS
ncbi:HD domain-containing protein [Sphingomonas sp. TX0522]|jgi:guanosine-3',5'-bis(diphosphate) 3'-pyrophosphohydrolase|uniref:HD domain-containing protein n=1 Tax=Sphingomonas sp. TX0522 TaxID=2479205 RepID=UPI0018E00299|nr:HD domain-containing protein [Sphingomonas sp. TX0522]MBI0533902.1 HD domain-containing protein [Sphingomonas sp. TX0522]